MSFRNKTEFFQPIAEGVDTKVSAKPLAASAGVYNVGKNRVLRIVVGAANVFAQLAKIKSDLAPTVDATNGILLEANSTVFMSSAEFEWMKVSGALTQVIVTADRG